MEQVLPRPLEVINHSNFSITLALEAGARGLPMAVSHSLLGSDIVCDNPHFKEFVCSHSGQKLLAIQTLNPDLAILHVQRADPERTLVPGLVVSAVCEVPWGAHPAPVQGYYSLDNPSYLDYAATTRTAEGSAA